MRKAHKLLAVVMWMGSAQAQADTPRVLANGSPAAGNTMAKVRPQSQQSKLALAEKVLVQAREQLKIAAQVEIATVQEFVTTPRVLANGAPACGNTMSKGPPTPCTQAIADAEQAQRFAAMQAAIEKHRLAKVRVSDARRTVDELRRSLAAQNEADLAG